MVSDFKSTDKPLQKRLHCQIKRKPSSKRIWCITSPLTLHVQKRKSFFERRENPPMDMETIYATADNILTTEYDAFLAPQGYLDRTKTQFMNNPLCRGKQIEPNGSLITQTTPYVHLERLMNMENNVKEKLDGRRRTPSAAFGPLK
ncbi:hypothetical protein KIN20_022533 [Parelaphostrongylus tenuis]|uniref:Uncharacterized protein n=1 Tax=Parelaphostrongylus tenuis TaxID=148309 RepID=A0AAD5MQF6_PARTN|nr:hypothetical protein KIN20_022533 [Parelaphostrongylus tenuis]